MKIDLDIGAYCIRLIEANNRPAFFWPHWLFQPFEKVNPASPDLQLNVTVTGNLPEIEHGRLIFDSCHGLWKLYEAGGGYSFESLNTQSRKPYIRANISEDYSNVDLWVRPLRPKGETRNGWLPSQVINPVVELCLNTRLGREGGMILHAAGVVTEDEGWIFTGPSGAGKSTLSGFFEAAGDRVLSDERLILRKIEDGYFVYGTPWPGTNNIVRNERAALKRIHFIKHGREGAHQIKKVSPALMCQLLLQQAFLPHWDRQAMQTTFDFAGRLVQEVECFEFPFLKNPDAVGFLKEQHRLAPA